MFNSKVESINCLCGTLFFNTLIGNVTLLWNYQTISKHLMLYCESYIYGIENVHILVRASTLVVKKSMLSLWIGHY